MTLRYDFLYPGDADGARLMQESVTTPNPGPAVEPVPTTTTDRWFTLPDQRTLVPWVCSTLFLVTVLPLFLHMPIICDVNFFDVGARCILRQELLCKEVNIVGVPTMPLLNAGVRSIVGWSTIGLRAFDALLLIGSVLVLAYAVIPHSNRAADAWTALALLLAYFATSEWCHCQPDVWMLAPVAGALALRVRQASGLIEGGRPVFRQAILEGTCWGIAFAIKPFAAVIALPCILLTGFLALRQRRWRLLATDLAGILLGGLLVGGALVAWLHLSGNWPYYVANNAAGPSLAEYYARSIPFTKRFLQLFVRLRTWGLVNLVALPVALYVLFRTIRSSRRDLGAAPVRLRQGVLACAYLGWLVQANFLQHQFDYHLVSPLLLGIALLASFEKWYEVAAVRRFVLPGLLIAAIAFNPLFTHDRLTLWPQCWTAAARPETLDRLGFLPKDQDHSFNPTWVELDRVAEYLRTQGVRHGELTCWSNSSLALYSQLEVEPSNRYVMLASFFYYMPGRSRGIITEIRSGPQRFIVADLVDNLGVPVHLASRIEGLPRQLKGMYPWSERLVFRSGRYFVFAADRGEDGRNGKPGGE